MADPGVGLTLISLLSLLGHLSLNSLNIVVSYQHPGLDSIYSYKQPENKNDRSGELLCLLGEGQSEMFPMFSGEKYLRQFLSNQVPTTQASYCSQTCQKNNWKTHKLSCKNYGIKVRWPAGEI